jgi:hypothetical protein
MTVLVILVKPMLAIFGVAQNDQNDETHAWDSQMAKGTP